MVLQETTDRMLIKSLSGKPDTSKGSLPEDEIPTCRGNVRTDHNDLSTVHGDDFLVPICGAVKKGHGSSSAHGGEAHGHSTGQTILLIVPIFLVFGCGTSYFLRRYVPFLPYTCVIFVEGFFMAVGKEMFKSSSYFVSWKSLSVAYGMFSNADPHLILYIFLPVLIFGESMSLNANMVANCFPQCMLLAGPGVLMGTILTGTAAKFILPYEWDWATSLLLGCILAATDPVAVVSIFKSLGVSPRLTMLISGESLLNDGVALVMFQLFIEMSQGVTPSAMGIAKFFAWMTTIGPAFGMGLGLCGVSALGHCSEHGKLEAGVHGDAMIQVIITFACAYLAFFIAESELHTSGVLSLVCCGMCMACYAWPRFNSRETVRDIWHIVDYVGNTLIFMLAGMILGDIVAARSHVITPLDLVYLLVIYVLSMVIRGIMMSTLWYPLNVAGEPISVEEATVMCWAGIRGAVGLLMAVVADQSPGITEETGTRILFYVGGMAALSLLANGTLTPFVLRLCGFRDTTKEQRVMLLEIRDRLAAKTRVQLDGVIADETKPFLFDSAKVSELPGMVQMLTAEMTTSSMNIKAMSKMGRATTSGFNEKVITYLRDTTRNIVKSVYWRMIEEGLLPRSSTVTQVVMNSSDIDAMSTNIDLNAFQSLKRRLKLGTWMDAETWDNRFTIASICTRPTVTQYFLRRPTFSTYCSRCVLACLAFIHAHEEAIEKIAEYWGMKTPEEEQIYDEVESEILKAKAFLEEMPQDLVATVKTKLMASKLLQSQITEIRSLAETGMITEENAEQLLETVAEDLHRNWHGWEGGWEESWN